MVATTINEQENGLWLIGGGGHAKVIAEAARLSQGIIAGYFDDRYDTAMTNCPRLGSLQDAFRHPGRTNRMILAVGDLSLRARLLERLDADRCATVIHPTSIVAASAAIGAGTYVGAGSIINPSVTIDRHGIVNTRAVIEHDCRLGMNSHVGPGAILGGGVIVGRGTLIGIHASVRPHIVIGENCTIGAGACVVADVPDGAIVVGVPARPIATSRKWRQSA